MLEQKKEVEKSCEKEMPKKDSNLNEDGSIKQDAWGEYPVTWANRWGI